MDASNISVVIPLYNKEREIAHTLQSVLGQTVRPREIIVVDDGSQDSSADVVESLHSPLIRLVRQPNAGVSAARNHGIEEASGEFVALLDGDDWWDDEFLSCMVDMMEHYPECDTYTTAYTVVRNTGIVTPAVTYGTGRVDNFWQTALNAPPMSMSSCMFRREAILAVGGFPVGMRIGEDLHTWIRMASHGAVCLSPKPLACYNMQAANRSVSRTTFRPEQTDRTFEELYDANACRDKNEYIAKCALSRAIYLSMRGLTDQGMRAERFFAYTHCNRRALWRLRIMNRTPKRLRAASYDLYNRLSWALAHKGN